MRTATSLRQRLVNICRARSTRVASKSRPALFQPRGLFEELEARQMLAIVWANEFQPNGFDMLGPNEAVARQLVNRAIDDWEAVVVDFDFDDDNNPLTNNTKNLSISVAELYGANGVSTPSGIWLDNDGAGYGWFFDQTPLDDAEFTSFSNAYEASFSDANSPNQNYYDLYRTTLHEIGHALGIYRQDSSGYSALWPMMQYGGYDAFNDSDLYVFHNPNGQYGVRATFTSINDGGHLHHGPADPAYPNTPIHPGDLMNAGYSLVLGTDPAGNPPTIRRLISDVDAMILADGYGYKVKLPSTFNTMHATLDSQTGVLLVQGRLESTTDAIHVDKVGTNVRVRVGATTELFPASDVTRIIIARNGHTGPVTNTGVGIPTNLVNYVVSTNQDSADAGVLGDGLVDLNPNMPGKQISLRAAVREANAMPPGPGIYIPRGEYRLTLAGPGGAEQGDLDVTGYYTMFGSGPGSTIIHGNQTDRIFDIASGGNLNLQLVTLTHGVASGAQGGAVLVRDGANLVLGNSSLVQNAATGQHGGALYFSVLAAGQIFNTAVTSNVAGQYGGGIFVASGNNGNVLVSGSIIAINTAQGGLGNDVYAEGSSAFSSGGRNRLTSAAAGFVHGVNGDHISATVHYIVTSVVDSFAASTDAVRRSLRDAVNFANTTAGAQEIWLPGWTFLLTRKRLTTPTDVTPAFGDLDISGSLVIRGVDASTKVRWRTGITDKVFELLGDYNNDGAVNAADYTIWQDTLGSTTDLRADGNDDGVINQADYNQWSSRFGNTLSLLGVT